MAAMLYAAGEHGLRRRWVGGQELYGRFRDMVDSPGREHDYLADLAAPAVLGISDPVASSGELSRWSLDQLYRLTDLRDRALRSTWIIVNAATPGEAEDRLSAPVFDRLRERATVLRCFWPSWREEGGEGAGPGWDERDWRRANGST